MTTVMMNAANIACKLGLKDNRIIQPLVPICHHHRVSQCRLSLALIVDRKALKTTRDKSYLEKNHPVCKN
jgi:hypothetical protein